MARSSESRSPERTMARPESTQPPATDRELPPSGTAASSRPATGPRCGLATHLRKLAMRSLCYGSPISPAANWQHCCTRATRPSPLRKAESASAFEQADRPAIPRNSPPVPPDRDSQKDTPQPSSAKATASLPSLPRLVSSADPRPANSDSPDLLHRAPQEPKSDACD